MKYTAKATFSEYADGRHRTDGDEVSFGGYASVAESMSIFHNLLTKLANRNVRTGTKLRITIETLPKKF